MLSLRRVQRIKDILDESANSRIVRSLQEEAWILIQSVRTRRELQLLHARIIKRFCTLGLIWGFRVCARQEQWYYQSPLAQR